MTSVQLLERTYCHHKAGVNFSRAFALKREGTAIRLIQVLLGHGSSKTTVIYPHVSKKHLQILKPTRSTYWNATY